MSDHDNTPVSPEPSAQSTSEHPETTEHPATEATAESWLSKAAFLISSPTLKQCPSDTGREVAFAGRSNAGKSSCINALTRQKQLARASKTPGRTQMINFFDMGNPEKRLVDLPGYGYAQVPEAMKIKWQKELEYYLQRRKSLCGLVLLMDSRRPLTDFDTQMLTWANAASLPCLVVLTKADKFNREPARKILKETQRRIDSLGLRADVQLFSATKHTGLDELREKIAILLDQPLVTSKVVI